MTNDDNLTLKLAEPVEGSLTGEPIERVQMKHANVAAAMASAHPPTNPNVLIDALDYWNAVVGYNDPIVQSMVSWLCYQLNDDISQVDAGLTADQHDALTERLEELGIEVGDDV